VTFQITKHFFDPHSASIILRGHAQIGKVGDQTKRFFLNAATMHEQANRIIFLGGQIALSQLDTFTGVMDETSEDFLTIAFIEPDPNITFLTQDEEPMPLAQRSQGSHQT